MNEKSKQKMTDAERGWAFAAQVSGADAAARSASTYVADVEKTITQLSENLAAQKSTAEISAIGGLVAEEWHAGTFNIDAAAGGSKSFATVLKGDRNKKWFSDIQLKSERGDVVNYSSKYMKNASETEKHQSALNPKTHDAGYKSQKRLVPSDQKNEVIEIANRRANNESRPEVAEAHRDTARQTVDTVTDGKTSSRSLSKEEDLEIAKEIKEDRVDLEKHGITVDSAIKPEYILKQAVKAGFSAATVTVILQTAPEIFKAIGYLVKTGELNPDQIKRIGLKALSSAAEGFLRGSVACTLQILCEEGAFGSAWKGIDATILGTMVALTLETAKNSILVAVGKMTPREMGNAFADGVMISGGYVIGSKLGGVIGQTLGFELPVIGYLLGSLLGCTFAAVYQFGKRKLISFCIDTGFTCFGLVEQDYTLPEEALRDMGIDIVKVARCEPARAEVSRTQCINTVDSFCADTVEIKLIRRGIIGVNRIGYVYS